MARRDDRRVPVRYAREEQRSQPGCIGARMQHDFWCEILKGAMAAIIFRLTNDRLRRASRGCTQSCSRNDVYIEWWIKTT
jgi:hypothetical protein